jgi:hypothetical protein
MLTYFLWFLAGALAHRILSLFLSIGYEKLIIEKTLTISAGIIKAIEGDVTKSVLFKHKSLIKSDLDRKVINDLISADRKFLSDWKESIFINVVAVLPPKYIKALPHFIFDKTTTLDRILKQLEEKIENEH